MKKYIPKPGVPKPTPVASPDNGKKKKAPIRKHSPNSKTEAKPRPLPTPGGKTDDGRRGPTPRPLPTPGGKIDDGKRYVGPRPMPTPKPDKKKKRGADKVGNVFIPDFKKPKGNRLKFLNQLSEMNKKRP